ncbi:MAG: hypothetical protein QXJ73_01210 [Candidatus Caldarchaeum sp.]
MPSEVIKQLEPVKAVKMVEISEEDIPFFAEVTAGGRITIPEEIRKIFEIKDGDSLLCKIRIVKKKTQHASTS